MFDDTKRLTRACAALDNLHSMPGIKQVCGQEFDIDPFCDARLVLRNRKKGRNVKVYLLKFLDPRLVVVVLLQGSVCSLDDIIEIEIVVARRFGIVPL